jgi:hypothetical protein
MATALSRKMVSITGFSPALEVEIEALGVPVEEAAELALSSHPRISVIEAALMLALEEPMSV